MSNSTPSADQSASSGGHRDGDRRILLTGVTGFLGQAVLRSLLETTDNTYITAVVRPKGSLSGLKRLEQLLRKPVFSSWADAL
ncbi:MAG: SDR family oxidoreductase, partial [Brachybacterium tyrofermentans]